MLDKFYIYYDFFFVVFVEFLDGVILGLWLRLWGDGVFYFRGGS